MADGLDLCAYAHQSPDVSVTAKKLRTALANLSETDRAELAQFLISSLDAGSDADADQAWDAELARRGEEIKSGKAIGTAAEQVFSELRQKHS
jgi:putative addiction module component (TIGR02574 family)